MFVFILVHIMESLLFILFLLIEFMKTSSPNQSARVSFNRNPAYSFLSSVVQQPKLSFHIRNEGQIAWAKKNLDSLPSNRLSPKSSYEVSQDSSYKYIRDEKKTPTIIRRNSSTVQNERPNVHYALEKTTTSKEITTKVPLISAKTSQTMKNIDNIYFQERRKQLFQNLNLRKVSSSNTQKPETKKINGDNFDIIKLLGKGKYGKVFLVREKSSGFLMALKVIQKKQIVDSDLLEQFIREIKIQFYLDHPGIIKLYGFFEDGKNFYLLMELGCDGQLYNYTNNGRTFSEGSASHVAKNLLNIFQYVHSKKIMHRDIKPENIVVIMGTVKLCDFGWAVHNSFQMRSTFCGTPLYFSPELLEGKAYDEKIDLWAIGVIIYELVYGKSPFNLQKPNDLPKIVTDGIDFPKNIKTSKQFRQFLERILEKNPNKRETAEILLSSSFIKKYKDNEICDELCRPLQKSSAANK